MRIITGCMRSGTSFVCQAARQLGADFGDEDDLIAGDQWNPNGYFEHRSVNLLNHQLLFGSWSNPHLWVDVMWPGPRWVYAKKLLSMSVGPVACRASSIRRRGRSLHEKISTLGAALNTNVVKDPRFAYVIEPWEQSASIESVLYVVRHPGEVASSLSRQTGLPRRLMYVAWRDSVKRFWSTPLGCPVYVVNYNAFFDRELCDRELRTVSTFLGLEHDPDRAASVATSVLDNRLHKQVAGSMSIPSKVQQDYRWLLEKHGAV